MDPELLKIAGEGKVGELHKFNKKKPKSLEGSTPKGNTALHIATERGHTDFVVAICELCPSILLLPNSRGDTALHTAARAGHSDIVRNLIKCAEKEKGRRDEMLKKLNMEHNTALHEAARNNHHEVASVLLEKDKPLPCHRNKAGATALCVAVEEGCLETIESILNANKQGKQLNWRGLHGRTPLHAAVIRQRIRATSMLLQHRPDFLNEKDDLENYPIHYAVALGDLRMVQLLLAKDKSIAYLGDKENKSPFLVAARNGRVRVMKELLLLCPHSGETTDDRNRNALHVAAERGNLEVVKYILSSNALRELINEPDEDGNTPLHLAISNHHFPVSNLLIREKVNLNVKNGEGMTVLDIVNGSSSSSTSKEPYSKYVGVGNTNYVTPSQCEPKLSRKFQKGLIRKALKQFGGKQVLQRRDQRRKEPRIESYEGLSRAISTVAGLIITVSFAAAFTIPGGYNSDGSDKGQAALAGKPFLWLFIMTDSLALFSSICVALLLFFAGLGDADLLVAAVSISLKLMAISLSSLTLSFLLGLWLVLSKGLALVVCLICIGVFFLTLHWFCSWFPLLSLLYFNFGFPNKLLPSFSRYSTQSSNQHSYPEAIMDNGHTYPSPETENVPDQSGSRTPSRAGEDSRVSNLIDSVVNQTVASEAAAS